jgi:hypothetical protein
VFSLCSPSTNFYYYYYYYYYYYCYYCRVLFFSSGIILVCVGVYGLAPAEAYDPIAEDAEADNMCVFSLSLLSPSLSLSLSLFCSLCLPSTNTTPTSACLPSGTT